jgi:hypothetical protein
MFDSTRSNAHTNLNVAMVGLFVGLLKKAVANQAAKRVQ